MSKKKPRRAGFFLNVVGTMIQKEFPLDRGLLGLFCDERKLIHIHIISVTISQVRYFVKVVGDKLLYRDLRLFKLDTQEMTNPICSHSHTI